MNRVSRNNQHWDARGREVPGYFELMSYIRDEKSKRVLRSHPLPYLVIVPACEVRIYVGNRETFDVITFGPGGGRHKTESFTPSRLKALARVVRMGGKPGWTLLKKGLFFSLIRETKIIVDVTGKYQR